MYNYSKKEESGKLCSFIEIKHIYFNSLSSLSKSSIPRFTSPLLAITVNLVFASNCASATVANLSKSLFRLIPCCLAYCFNRSYLESGRVIFTIAIGTLFLSEKLGVGTYPDKDQLRLCGKIDNQQISADMKFSCILILSK